jgi:hypothetical protein
MKISKKDLLEQLDMDEMAHKSKGVQAPRISTATGQLKPSKYKPYFSEGNDTDIPDAWIINLQQIPGQDEGVVLLHGAQLDAFINENAALLDKLNEMTGGNLKIYEGNKTKYHPRSKKVGTQYVSSGNKISVKEAILRKFNPILKEFLTNRVNEHLTKCGLSPINTYENQAAVDKYSEISNHRLDWESHDYDFFNNVFDFSKAAKQLMLKGGTEIEIYRTHMPRQYNPGTNWSALRKTEKMGSNFKADPLTPVYALAKRGYEADDKDVALSTTLHITGRLEQTHTVPTLDSGYQYVWSAKITTAYGKKLKEEMRVNSGKFEKDKEFVAHNTVEFNYPNFDPETMNIMNVGPVADGLKSLLDSLANQILEINPREELLKRVRVQQTDVTKRPEALNENELISLVKNTLTQLNN